jgi:peptidoglycan-N-acetylglucosamine deacetylase
VIDEFLSHIERVPPALLKQALGSVLWEGDVSCGALALTFDDGPDPLVTPAVLDVLDTYGAKATFFLTGTQAQKHPELVRDIGDRGHLIGNHTMTHRRLLLVGEDEVAREIGDAARIIEDTAGKCPRYVRPPFGLFDFTTLRVVRERGDTLVCWTALAGDYRDITAGRLLENVTPFVRAGAVLVFHDTARGGGDLLPGIIGDVARMAADAGLKLDTVERLGNPASWERADDS